MGNLHAFFSHSIPHFNATIVTNDGGNFEISNFELIDHILLLRQVIAHQEMIEKGEVLDYYIEEYCKRMSHQAMTTIHQQLELPWQIDWIWHVHRLHPIAYNNDCIRQLSSGQLVDKRCLRLTTEQYQKHHLNVSSESIKGHMKFVPSFDLTSAVLSQRAFLEKFKNHYLFSMNLKHMNRNFFEQMIQNYVSFLKLSNENEIIVPTFDIDLIWHTHMRFPSHYQKASIGLCGFLLDHNDFIEKNLLTDAYQKTAHRWKNTYKTDYGKIIDKDYLQKFQFISSCAMIIPSVSIYTTGEYGDTSGGISHGGGTIKGESADGGDPSEGGGGRRDRCHSDNEHGECSESSGGRFDVDTNVDSGGCSGECSDGGGNLTDYGG